MRSQLRHAALHALAVARLGEHARTEVGLAQGGDRCCERHDRRSADSLDDSNKRILRNFESKQDPGRSRQHLTQHRQSRGISFGDPAGNPTPFFGLVITLEDRDRHRPADVRPDAAASRIPSSASSKSEITCIQPAPMSTQCAGYRGKFRLLRIQGRDVFSHFGLVVQRARCRETESPCPDPFRRERPSPCGPAPWPARDRHRAGPSRRRAPRRAAPASRCPYHTARSQRIEEIGKASASSMASPRSAQPRECPRHPPSVSPASRAALACMAQSRRRSCRTAWSSRRSTRKA